MANDEDNMLEQIINELDPLADDEIFDFSELQLICFEDYDVYCKTCECHNFPMLKPGAAFTTNAPCPFFDLLWRALEHDYEAGIGTFFVSSSFASMFADCNPIFFTKDIDGIRGMLIHVTPTNRFTFLLSIAKIFDVGSSPCLYLRKILVFGVAASVLMFTEPWFKEATDLYSFWQDTQQL